MRVEQSGERQALVTVVYYKTRFKMSQVWYSCRRCVYVLLVQWKDEGGVKSVGVVR